MYMLLTLKIIIHSPTIIFTFLIHIAALKKLQIIENTLDNFFFYQSFL